MSQTFRPQILTESRGRRVIRQAHDFKGERCHIAPFQFPGEPVHLFVCDRCGEVKAANQFPVMWRLMARSKLHEASIYHPNCLRCRNQMRGVWTRHELYSPQLDDYWSKYMPGLRGGAKQRGIAVAIDKDDLLGLYLESGGKCAITGLPTDWKSKSRPSRHSDRRVRATNSRSYKAPSVDRIDSAGNYTLGNIQIVMSIVNTMKSDLPMDIFVAMCEQIVSNNITRMDVV